MNRWASTIHFSAADLRKTSRGIWRWLGFEAVIDTLNRSSDHRSVMMAM